MKINEMVRVDEKGLKIKSIDLVDVINRFRSMEVEGKKELQHGDFMKKIRKEVKTLESLGLRGQGNFSSAKYFDKQGKERECYELNRDGMLQMLNSESTLVRYKTVEYINTLEKENKQLNEDSKKLYGVSISNEEQEKRQYEADKVYYAINNIEKRLRECNYTNIVAIVDKIVDVHTNLYVKDRYKPHQNTEKYGNKGENLYINHVKGIIVDKLDKLRPEMTLKDANINSIMLDKARQLENEIEKSKNISDGKEIGKLKREKTEIKINAAEWIKELSRQVV
ncbi:Rha family transcriptional regulator [Wukongibacter sp. M2B1]|uniref:Rha family transcriptional regulator n=1 Tax=Wukongibacter sp. M2B1 TaxID=3088895 RepID=UPI003D7A8ED0